MKISNLNNNTSKGSIQVPYGSKVYWKTDNSGYIEEKGVALGELDELINIDLIKSVNVGEIIMWNGTDFISVRPEDLTITHKESGYNPIGVVVVPNFHNVYGNNYCGIVGLYESSTTWGPIKETVLRNFSKLSCIGSNGSISDVVQSVDSSTLPSDNFSDALGPTSTDGISKYKSDSTNYSPSPYNSDGSRNSLYSSIDPPCEIFNRLSEFSGVTNTNALFFSGEEYPAINYCKNYRLNNIGNWYLPTLGELGYVCSRLRKINESIKKIKEIYTEDSDILAISSSNYWTSSEFSDNEASIVDLSDGTVGVLSKTSSSKVRPFFRLRKVSASNTVTLTINPTPAEAKVIINGKERYSMPIFSGSTANYEVYYDNYIKSSGSVFVENEDKTVSVTLDPAPNLGDIALWNNNKLVFSSPENLTQHSSEIPVGVVVIPANHNVYNNGCCCILGLSEEDKEWGVDSAATSDTSLNNYNNVVYIGTNGELGDGSAKGVFDSKSGSYPYFSSDLLNVETSSGPISLDKVGKYRYSSSSSYYIPSPYNSDGSRNFVYSTIKFPSDESNAAQDFNGKSNTTILSGFDGFNAAKWCMTYKTSGTKENEWFIPGYGELGYIFSRFSLINSSINKINEVFSNKPATILSQIDYWSSSEYSNSKARFINFYEGLSDSKNKDTSLTVRPCYQFPVLKTYTLNIETTEGTIWINEEKRNSITVIAGTEVNYVVSIPGRKVIIESVVVDRDLTIKASSYTITLEIGDYLLEGGAFLPFSEFTEENKFIPSLLVGVYVGSIGSVKRFVRIMSTEEFTRSTCAWYNDTSTPSLQSGYVNGYPIGATSSESDVKSRTQGKESTNWLVNSDDYGWNSSKPAAEFARSYEPTPAISNGKYYWNLPCAGELELVMQNKTVIKNSVVKAGGYGESIDPSGAITRVWVSTQYSVKLAWTYSLSTGNVSTMSIFSESSVFVLPMASY